VESPRELSSAGSTRKNNINYWLRFISLVAAYFSGACRYLELTPLLILNPRSGISFNTKRRKAPRKIEI
jgi:hypothetical protein